MKNVTLSPEQNEALSTLLTFVHKSQCSDRFIALTAPAGCGKTTLVTKFIEHLNPMLSVCVCSPTNKALNILNKNRISDKADYKTIYSLLGLVPINNKDTKKVTKKGKFKLKDYDVVIIDEASMLPTMVIDFLNNALDEIANSITFKEVKIIFVGDSFQLPPVSEKFSPALAIDNKVTLSTVMRSDDIVLSLCTQVRGYVGSGFVPNLSNFETSLDNKGNGIHVVSKSEFNKRILSDFTKPITDRDSVRIVSYTNHSIDMYNGMIREANGLDKFVKYYPNELVLAKEPITQLMTLRDYHITDGIPNGADSVLCPIATEFLITEVELGKGMEWTQEDSDRLGLPLMYPFQIYTYELTCVPLDDEDGSVITFRIPTDFSYYNQLKTDFANIIKSSFINHNVTKLAWEVFYRLRDFVATPQSIFALTSHGSQGSSFEKVYVDAGNILAMCKYDEDTALRSLYVAVSRAKTNVVLTF